MSTQNKGTLARFRWGYQDAMESNKAGVDNEAGNYGFAKPYEISTPCDLLTQHYDKVYAYGFMYGWLDTLSPKKRGLDDMFKLFIQHKENVWGL